MIPSFRFPSVSPGFNSSLIFELPTFLIGCPFTFLKMDVQVTGPSNPSGVGMRADFPFTILNSLKLPSSAGGIVLILTFDVSPFFPVASILSLIFPGVVRSIEIFSSLATTSYPLVSITTSIVP